MEREATFYQNWGQEYDLGYINQDIFLVNFSKCTANACQNCYLTIKQTHISEWTYHCPLYRNKQDIAFKALSAFQLYGVSGIYLNKT